MNVAALKNNKWLRRALIAILVWLAFWALLWALVPPIGKHYAQKIASEQLGRTVTIGKIDVKPWTLELALDDLRIKTADGSGDQVHIRRIYVNAEAESVFRLAPVIDAVSIEAPALKLTRLGDGKYDIDDILARLAVAPKSPPDKSDEKAARFAVYNIALSNGSFDFIDKAIDQTHALRELTLRIPFLSNFDAKREIQTDPKLAFVLDGTQFASNAESTPFAANRKTDAQLNFEGLDLAPYLGYMPRGLPVQLQAGKLDAELKIDFEQSGATGLKLSGQIAAREARLADSGGGDLLAFDALVVELADVRPLEQKIHLANVTLIAPRFSVRRDARGGINLLESPKAAGEKNAQATPGPASQQEPQATPGATKNVAASADPSGAAATKDPKSEETAGSLALRVDKIAVEGGQLDWRDQTTDPAAAVKASDLKFEVRGVSWPIDKPAAFEGGLALEGVPITFGGQATDKTAQLNADIGALPLSLVAPYLSQTLTPNIEGKLSAKLDVDWQAPALRIVAKEVLGDSLALKQGKESLASIDKLKLTDAQVDLGKNTLAIGSIAIEQPKTSVERDKNNRWMFESWLKKAPASDSAEKPDEGASNSASAKKNASDAWQVRIAKLGVEGGAIAYADRGAKIPVLFDISGFKLAAENIAPGVKGAMKLNTSGQIGTGGRSKPGRFGFTGSVGLEPVIAEGRVDLKDVPAHAFKNYYADLLNNVDIRRALFGYSGKLRYAASPKGPDLRLTGDTSLEELRAVSSTLSQARGVGSSNQLLRWKALGLRGLDVRLAPGKPPVVDVKQTSLTDFFARVIIDENGRINLQDLTSADGKKGAGTEPPRTAAQLAAAPTGSGSAAIEIDRPGEGADGAPPVQIEAGTAPAEITTDRDRSGTTTTTRKPAGSSAAAQASGRPVPAEEQVGAAADAPTSPAPAPKKVAKGPQPVIHFGPISLTNGQIDFTDNFIKPNYSANLTELDGKLSSFSSETAEGQSKMADLELTGKAQQTAALNITGQLNPLADPLELDIKAKVTDLDLAPLSPYSVRYAGHGIERGKLSMDVEYAVKADGQLTATNKLVLNQLRFGNEVAGSKNSLPVKLAVALLADRDGVIDLDLPLSGSLNDPQFSIGPLIWKALGNLIVKAATAPFALLTGGFGGGNEASAVEFAPGSAELSDDARKKLDKVAKALADRPRLKMTVAGTASLKEEADAYKERRLKKLVQAEKRREVARSGKDAKDVAPVTDAEYPRLLAEVYDRNDKVEKPRNFIGITKDVPVAEMEKLLLGGMSVDENAMRDLAVERGTAVRDYLLEKQLKSDRLFLGAVKTGTEDPKWKPRADLSLETG